MAVVECLIESRPRHAHASIITLAGEHDFSTIDEDKAALTAAIASGDGDVVLDVSGVTFMSAGTVGLILHARQVLESRSRSLRLQSPSRSAKRVLDLCGVA
ncbi:MAG: STAS domain-containing protein [Acidimicrobiales bacterium]